MLGRIKVKPSTIKFTRPWFFLAGMKIPIVTHCKYLGVIMSEHNSDNDLKRQMRKFYANANMLIRKFSKCSVNVKCYLFKTYCSTMYCSALKQTTNKFVSDPTCRIVNCYVCG